MGGSSSRFDEMEWNKANGKCEQTIDDAPPTDSYGIYYLTKLGVNQREYNVTDSESNLLYRTRAVEGTVAWFDVLGPAEEDDYRLRVTVGLSRRYWVVYHYGMPAFLGQMWDENATERLSCRGGWRKPLFRRACITVTWARYHAIVDLYEPAPAQEEQDREEDEGLSKMKDEMCTEPSDGEIEGSNIEVADSRASVARTEELHRGADDRVIGEPATCNGRNLECMDDGGTVDIVKSQCNAQDGNDEMRRDSESLPSLHVASQSTTVEEEEPEPGTGETIDRQQAFDQASGIGASIRWVQSKAMESVAAPYRPLNKDEGVITLDKPVLKVQEINSIVGKHQTMLIPKEEARKLKREELLIEANLAREAQKGLAGGVGDDDRLKDFWQRYSYQESGSADDISEVEDNNASTDSKDLARSESGGFSTIMNVCSDSCLLMAPSQNGLETTPKIASTGENKNAQPLVGYWEWENSLRVHRMKMHLAQGSDLALHIVLAVVTNQLRYERHATVAVAI